MNAQEKRQAQRIVRNAKEVERRLFEFIEQLQEASAENADPYDWNECKNQLSRVSTGMVIIYDLVLNMRSELPQLETPGKERGL